MKLIRYILSIMAAVNGRQLGHTYDSYLDSYYNYNYDYDSWWDDTDYLLGPIKEIFPGFGSDGHSCFLTNADGWNGK